MHFCISQIFTPLSFSFLFSFQQHIALHLLIESTIMHSSFAKLNTNSCESKQSNMMSSIGNKGKLSFKIQSLKGTHQWNLNMILCILAIFESKGIDIDIWQVMNQTKYRQRMKSYYQNCIYSG